METEGTINQVLPLSLAANQSTLTRYAQGDRERVNSLTADNLLQFDFATGPVLHTVITGVDYQTTTFDQYQTQAVTSSLNMFAPNYNQVIATPTAVAINTLQHSQQTGIYAQDQLRLGGFTVTASGRQDWADSDTLNRVTNRTMLQSDTAGTGRIGGSYLFGNGVAPYVAYATSFNPQAGTTFAGAAFRPTTGELKEGGIKYQPGAFPALFTIAAFELVQQNVLTADPLHIGFSVQTGEITSRGLELEGKARVYDSLDLLAAYTYTDAKVTASNGADLNKWPSYIPRNTASLLADYTFQRGPLTGFGGGGGVRYIGETYGDAANTYQVPGYTVFDAMLHYDLAGLDPSLRGFKLALNATNLFDKVYVSQCTNTNCLYGLRRTVLGSVKYLW
jgi:iron complex outermembrane recepter protein